MVFLSENWPVSYYAFRNPLPFTPRFWPATVDNSIRPSTLPGYSPSFLIWYQLSLEVRSLRGSKRRDPQLEGRKQNGEIDEGLNNTIRRWTEVSVDVDVGVEREKNKRPPGISHPYRKQQPHATGSCQSRCRDTRSEPRRFSSTLD